MPFQQLIRLFWLVFHEDNEYNKQYNNLPEVFLNFRIQVEQYTLCSSCGYWIYVLIHNLYHSYINVQGNKKF